MDIYTFILEYRGGTYIKQINSSNPQDALQKWINELDSSVVWGLDEFYLQEIQRSFEEDGFGAISDNVNVWCFIFTINEQLGLVNFVLTSNHQLSMAPQPTSTLTTRNNGFRK